MPRFFQLLNFLVLAMAAASIAVPGAVFQCQLPANVQDAISVVQKMRPETNWANVLVSSRSDQLEPGDALDAEMHPGSEM